MVAYTNRGLGPAAAALVSAGIGSFALGFMICATEASKGFKNWANWYNPVGPLSGKTGMAILAWLVAWAILTLLWKDRAPNFRTVTLLTMILIALGFLGSFPPFFDLFSR